MRVLLSADRLDLSSGETTVMRIVVEGTSEQAEDSPGTESDPEPNAIDDTEAEDPTPGTGGGRPAPSAGGARRTDAAGTDAGHPFRFDRSDYPGIAVLPLDAYKAGRPVDSRDRAHSADVAESFTIQRIRRQAETASDEPMIFDWNTMLGLHSNNMGDSRDVMRFYLTYQVSFNPESNTCVVTIDVFEGLPYDPSRPSLGFYQGVAVFGESDRDGEEIQYESRCVKEATERALDQVLQAGYFAAGWSKGPPQHMRD